MIIYSKKIIAFVSEVKNIIKNILIKEARLKVVGNRFYKKQTSYPIYISIYHSKAVLGYFDPSFYELSFNECLMHAKHELLENVIRNEHAHYLTFIEYGHVQAHGHEFKQCCARLNWGEDISKASICLEKAAEIPHESPIFRKVKKLMALGSSSNQNEAEQAIIKSQQLLLKHNIEYVESSDDEVFYLKRIMRQGKKTAKMCAIGRILETFFVSIVYHRATDGTYLEILGDKSSVEIGEYVAKALDFELEKFWQQAPKPAHKNSFFFGIAKGYCNKVEKLKNEYSDDVSNALILVEKKLIDAKAMAYKNLVYRRTSTKYCGKSSSLGEQIGRFLNISPAIQKSSDLRFLT